MIELARHQRVAAERALALLRARGGVILADDVGLGKSFVAASVAARFGGDIECIVPAGLVKQWRETLDAFRVDASITTHDKIVNERGARCSGERLLIVDEAHAFRNPQTLRHDALARRSIGARLLLITATPICNSPDDLYALVSLIAADDALRGDGIGSVEEGFRFRRADEIATVLRELVIRRGRNVLDDSMQFGALQRTVLRYEVPDVSIGNLRFPLVEGSRTLLHAVLWRRLESSEEALTESLHRQKRFYQRALDCLASGRTLTKREYRRAFGDEDGEAFQEVLFWEVFATAEARIEADDIHAELERIETLQAEIDALPRLKLAQLHAVLATSREPAIVFTSAIATAKAIFAAANVRAGLLTSHQVIPANALERFSHGRLDVLIATDLAAEGLNLQHAGVIVHYDMPWNPVKLDQRNGRAFRIGQTREVVHAVYFVPRRSRTRILRTLVAKNRVRRHLFAATPDPQPSTTLTALPARLTRSSAAVALAVAMRKAGLDAPAVFHRRYRAGIERLIAETAAAPLTAERVSALTSALERERIIDGGASLGPADR